MPFFFVRLFVLLALVCAALPAWAGETATSHLLFCNRPEKMRIAGAYADARLQGGHTYTIFYHYKNVSSETGAFVVALHGSPQTPFKFMARQGFADPQHDPPLAGRQAMARFLSAPERDFNGKGGARFAYALPSRQVASGVLTVRCEGDARLRIYFKHDRWTVPHAEAIIVDAPRREIDVDLSPDNKRQTFRIGQPERGMNRRMDGTYGMLYAFRVAAPPGRRIRVSFSPRGGKGGLVGSMGGTMHQTGIVRATDWAVYGETTVGKSGGVTLTTAPFGGVFYPVELVFQLM